MIIGYEQTDKLKSLGIKPCKCGSTDLIIWEPKRADSWEDSLGDLEKIECQGCGNVVYGCEDAQIEDWNNQDYH
jgi:hypothetical protein